MNQFANAIKHVSTVTRTENGAKTYTTSFDQCVDMFFQIAAIRGQGSKRAEDLFRKAYTVNPDLAVRIALWARDAREGAGERQVFRDILKLLEKIDIDRLKRILPLVPELGRWDDMFIFETDEVKQMAYALVGRALTGENPGLVAKWMPRETGADKLIARELHAFFEISAWGYRKMIVTLSNTVEQKMSAKLWDEIEFSHVPSVAMSRYSKAFRKQQPDRFNAFIQSALKGETKINTKALFPYDVTKATVDAETANALWKNLPDYVPEGKSFMPMIDLSGSMTAAAGSDGKSKVSCMDVAISLGIYLAERNKSAFKNLAMSFSRSPKWINIPETDSIAAKVNAVRRGDMGYDTNIDAGFELLVQTAVRNDVRQDDMPEYLMVFSDMEFNASYSNKTNADAARMKFERAGYKMPTLVWWNIQSRNGNVPVRANDKGMLLVSGFSPVVTKTVLSGALDPAELMMATVSIERYDH